MEGKGVLQVLLQGLPLALSRLCLVCVCRSDDGPGSGPVMLQHEDGTTSVSVFHDELRRRLEEYVVQSRGLFSVSSARPVLTTMHKLVSKVMAQRYAPAPQNLFTPRRPRQRAPNSSRGRA